MVGRLETLQEAEQRKGKTADPNVAVDVEQTPVNLLQGNLHS